MRKIVFILPAVLMGCVKPPAPEEIRAANYGPPPANYQATIKADFNKLLIDPTSPIYTFDKPFKSYTAGQPATYGWTICGTLNSKNRMGGYTGAAPFYVIFRHGQIADQMVAEETMWYKNVFATCTPDATIN